MGDAGYARLDISSISAQYGWHIYHAAQSQNCAHQAGVIHSLYYLYKSCQGI